MAGLASAFIGSKFINQAEELQRQQATTSDTRLNIKQQGAIGYQQSGIASSGGYLQGASGAQQIGVSRSMTGATMQQTIQQQQLVHKVLQAKKFGDIFAGVQGAFSKGLSFLPSNGLLPSGDSVKGGGEEGLSSGLMNFNDLKSIGLGKLPGLGFGLPGPGLLL